MRSLSRPIAAGASPGGNAPKAYRDLGRWLARAIGWCRALRSVEDAGRQIGCEPSPELSERPVDALRASLTALGFQPEVKPSPTSSVTFCLGNCPYRDAVQENQPVICRLHHGITRGLLDGLAPQAKLAAFVPRDPAEAGCTIEVRKLDAAPA